MTVSYQSAISQQARERQYLEEDSQRRGEGVSLSQ
jgi:hypothetical protein